MEEPEPWEAGVGQAFGRVLAKTRIRAGLSQEQLAHEAGVHRTYISLLERGRYKPSLTTVFKLARALDMPPYDLVRRVEKEMRAGGADLGPWHCPLEADGPWTRALDCSQLNLNARTRGQSGLRDSGSGTAGKRVFVQPGSSPLGWAKVDTT